MNRLKKNDDVIIIAGKNKGRRGTVISLLSNKNFVLIEGVNIIKKHVKPNINKNIEGGIVEKESPVHVSNVALYDSSLNKAGRIGYTYIENNKKKSRYFKSNGSLID